MKPWTHHTVAVFAAALAIYGRASVPAETKPIEVRSNDRRVSLAIRSLLSRRGDVTAGASRDFFLTQFTTVHRRVKGPRRPASHDLRSQFAPVPVFKLPNSGT